MSPAWADAMKWYLRCPPQLALTSVVLKILLVCLLVRVPLLFICLLPFGWAVVVVCLFKTGTPSWGDGLLGNWLASVRTRLLTFTRGLRGTQWPLILSRGGETVEHQSNPSRSNSQGSRICVEVRDPISICKIENDQGKHLKSALDQHTHTHTNTKTHMNRHVIHTYTFLKKDKSSYSHKPIWSNYPSVSPSDSRLSWQLKLTITMLTTKCQRTALLPSWGKLYQVK